MNIFQQGDKDVVRDFYDTIIHSLPKQNLRLLNLGSGKVFSFEKRLRELRSEFNDIIDCVDIIPLERKSEYIDSYSCRSIEEPCVINGGGYDCVFAFEVIEHIDKTDEIIKNAYSNLKGNGIFFISHPNLSSLYARMELLMGFQPHVLEPSNENPNAGGGVFARRNNAENVAIHHIRGITARASKELLQYHGFAINKIYGQDNGFAFLSHFPALASVICIKAIKETE